MTTKERIGWGFPLLARKAHFFYGMESLCGKWMFFGDLDPDDGKVSPDDCAACRRLLVSEVAV